MDTQPASSQTTAQHLATAQLIAQDFRGAMAGKLEPEKIEAAAQQLVATANRYPAKGSVASLIFYLKFQVTIDGGKQFNGHAGGASSPGGGALFGDVYTDNLDRLYRETQSFEFQATPVYTSLLFFDGSGTLLGHFQAGAVSIVTGIGGGRGEWS